MIAAILLWLAKLSIASTFLVVAAMAFAPRHDTTFTEEESEKEYGRWR